MGDVKPSAAAGRARMRAPRLPRAQKAQKIREALLHAAAMVVGREGYAGAQISMITAEADVAQGTFYNYFESRQHMFDELLPQIGQEMLDFIREQTVNSKNYLDREERSFCAFFTFLKARPEFYRILYEAELFAPSAFQRHMELVAAGYVRALQRAWKQGELRVRSAAELEPMATMLMGARHYLCMRYARRGDGIVNLPDRIVRTYMNLVTNGIYLFDGATR